MFTPTESETRVSGNTFSVKPPFESARHSNKLVLVLLCPGIEIFAGYHKYQAYKNPELVAQDEQQHQHELQDGSLLGLVFTPPHLSFVENFHVTVLLYRYAVKFCSKLLPTVAQSNSNEVPTGSVVIKVPRAIKSKSVLHKFSILVHLSWMLCSQKAGYSM